MLNKTEAKIIILLAQLPKAQANVFYISTKMNLHPSTTYNYFRMLEAKGYLSRLKDGRKAIIQIKDIEENLEKAKGVLSDVS